MRVKTLLVEEVDQRNQILPMPILLEILKSGLVIAGGKGEGKSNSAKVLLAEIMRQVDQLPFEIQCKIFDTACNWRWMFEPILFQEVKDGSRYIYNGKKDILYDVAMTDEDVVMNFIQKIVMNDFEAQRQKKIAVNGDRTKFGWKLYCLEEAQSSLSRFSLIRRNGKRMLKSISEGRNMNQCYIVIGQRLAEMATGLIERCHGMMFGKMVGANDLRKIRNKCGAESGIAEEVKQLDVGQFIYWNGNSAYKFYCPEYIVDTQPVEWLPTNVKQQVWQHFYGRQII